MLPTERPRVEPALAPSEMDYLMRGMLRIPQVFVKARQTVRPDHFDPHLELPYRLVWSAALRLADRYGVSAVCGDNVDACRESVETEVLADIQRSGESTNNVLLVALYSPKPESPGLITYIYSGSAESLVEEQVVDYLRRFLSHRRVQETLRRDLNAAGGGVIVDMPAMLRTLATEAAAISSLDSPAVETANLENWYKNVSNSMRYSTGIGFLDRMLDGGQMAGEVYGVLGAYGSGKTLFSVQLACQSAVYQVTQSTINPSYKPKCSVIVHYEATSQEIRSRIGSHLAEIHYRELVEMDLSRLSRADGSVPLKDYEKEHWKEAIRRNDLSFVPEFERLQSRLSLFGDYICLLDMSGMDVRNPKRGSGYVQEVADILQTEILAKGLTIGCVVIDYAGLCARRYMRAKNLRPDSLRHLIGDFGDCCRQLIAVPMNCPVWVMHQLAAAANKRTYANLQHHADAAEAKNFVENMVYAFNISVPHDTYRTVLFNVTKARRSKPAPPEFLWINGAFQRFEPARKYYHRNVQTGEVIPLEAAKGCWFLSNDPGWEEWNESGTTAHSSGRMVTGSEDPFQDL